MEKCSLQQKNRPGSQSQGSDSTMSMKRVTDYRQKRKARAIAACTQQKTPTARRVKQRAVKADSQIVNSSSNRDSINDSQCSNFGINVKPDRAEGELVVKQELVTCPFKHCTHTFKSNFEFRQHMNEKHRAQLTLKSLISISPTVNKKTHLLSDEKDKGSKVESSNNTTFNCKMNKSNATNRGGIHVKKEPINLNQAIKREPSWGHDSVDTTESAEKAQTPEEVVEEDRESFDELNEMQEHEDGYAGVKSEDRSIVTSYVP